MGNQHPHVCLYFLPCHCFNWQAKLESFADKLLEFLSRSPSNPLDPKLGATDADSCTASLVVFAVSVCGFGSGSEK